MAFRSLGLFGKVAVIGTAASFIGTYSYFRVYPGQTEIYKTWFDINITPRYIDDRLVAVYNTYQKQENNNSLLKKHLTPKVFDKIHRVKTRSSSSLKEVIEAGIANPDDPIGVCAPEPASYEYFKDLFDPIIAELHGNVRRQPDTDWGEKKLNQIVEKLDEDGRYVKQTKIECRRNIDRFYFHPLMRQDDYYLVELKFRDAFEKIVDDDLRGAFVSLRAASNDEKETFKKAKVGFKNDDKFLQSAHVYQHFPAGRAIYYNNYDNKSIVGYVNDEDHLKLVSTVPGGDVKTAFDRLSRCIKQLETHLKFARNDRLGNITFSPADLGSAVRASVEIKLSNVSKNEDFRETCDKLKLKIRDLGNDVFIVSNKQKFGVSEFEAVKQMYDGVKKLIEMEKGGGEQKDRK